MDYTFERVRSNRAGREFPHGVQGANVEIGTHRTVFRVHKTYIVNNDERFNDSNSLPRNVLLGNANIIRLDVVLNNDSTERNKMIVYKRCTYNTRVLEFVWYRNGVKERETPAL